MSAYMDTPAYAVNKFISTHRVMLGRSVGPIVTVGGIGLYQADLEALVQEHAAFREGLEELAAGVGYADYMKVARKALDSIPREGSGQ